MRPQAQVRSERKRRLVDEEPTDRDYWDIELSDGALYRIYRNRTDGAWFADGIYD